MNKKYRILLDHPYWGQRFAGGDAHRDGDPAQACAFLAVEEASAFARTCIGPTVQCWEVQALRDDGLWQSVAAGERDMTESEARIAATTSTATPAEITIPYPLYQRLVEIMEHVPPCLRDWIASTGYGEVNRRDRRALAAVEAAKRIHAAWINGLAGRDST